MQKRFSLGAIALIMVLLSACEKKQEPVTIPEPAAIAPAPEASKRSMPDFGASTKVSREVEAVGSTLELAVLSALQSAVAQVNGVRVASQLQSLRAGLDVVVNGQNEGSARVEAFSQAMVSGSEGLVLAYEIIAQEEIDKIDEESISKVRASDAGSSYSASAEGRFKASSQSDVTADYGSANYSGSASESSEYKQKSNIQTKKGASSYTSDTTNKKISRYWKVRVRADIAQYRAPDEAGRPKIIVALAKTLARNYPVGDSTIASEEVAQAVRSRLSDILTQTKRFIVLDREFGDDMQAEIDQINSGNVRPQDAARLGQRMATDLILIPTIERFEYSKAVKKLRMSDRELISYSGGGRITLRLLNAATGEVVLSDSFEHKLAAADPSTMPRVIDGKGMAAQMMDQLSSQIGGAIVAEIFPVSVVALVGDQAVLSQGGDSLQAGQRWQAVYLGEELKDPQTGRSLGRNETPAGIIRIDRVSSQTSYGTLEIGVANFEGKPFTPGAIELRKLAVDIAVKKDEFTESTNLVENEKQGSSKQIGAAQKIKKPVRASSLEPSISTPKPEANNDEKW